MGDESPTSISADRLRTFDGLTYYWSSQNPYANPDSFAQVRHLGAKVHAAHKPWFAPFAPGFQLQLEGGTCVPRRHGDTLQRLYNGNRKSNPEAMCLISWNEITEGTYIEPLRRYGDGTSNGPRNSEPGPTRPSARRRCRTSRPSGRSARPARRTIAPGRQRTHEGLERLAHGSARPFELASELCGNLHPLALHPFEVSLGGWQRGAAGSLPSDEHLVT